EPGLLAVGRAVRGRAARAPAPSAPPGAPLRAARGDDRGEPGDDLPAAVDGRLLAAAERGDLPQSRTVPDQPGLLELPARLGIPRPAVQPLPDELHPAGARLRDRQPRRLLADRLRVRTAEVLGPQHRV